MDMVDALRLINQAFTYQETQAKSCQLLRSAHNGRQFAAIEIKRDQRFFNDFTADVAFFRSNLEPIKRHDSRLLGIYLSSAQTQLPNSGQRSSAEAMAPPAVMPRPQSDALVMA